MKTTQDHEKMMFYERFAKDFDSQVNMYDTRKRLEVFFEELLTEDITGKKVLDAGCGTGWFGARAAQVGAQVTSMDVGDNLLQEVAKKCTSERVIGSITEMPFKNNTFDYIVCSEVVEHIPYAGKAFSEMYRVLKPGGVLILSTPNRFWHWTLAIANAFHLRPYQGLENWLSYDELEHGLKRVGFHIEKMQGIHAFPFVVPILNPILDVLHGLRIPLRRYMVNLAVRCHK